MNHHTSSNIVLNLDSFSQADCVSPSSTQTSFGKVFFINKGFIQPILNPLNLSVRVTLLIIFTGPLGNGYFTITFVSSEDPGERTQLASSFLDGFTESL